MHPSTDAIELPSEIRAILKHFEYEHLPPHLEPFSMRCHDVAHAMAYCIPDDPELRAGLRKLLEAKDCFVRAALATSKKPSGAADLQRDA